MTFHRGYSEDHQDVALQWFVTRRTARRRVRIAALAAAVIFGALGFAAGSAWGEDSVTVLPPEGILCIPESCTATAMEGFIARVVAFDWRGM